MIPVSQKRSRCWCYTIFDYEEKKLLNKTPESVYQVFGYEICPETGKKHIQGYLVYKEAKTMTTVKKSFNDQTMHLEIPKGNAEQNRKYCTKEGNFIETGTIPQQGKRNDIDTVRELVKEGKGFRDILEVASNFQCLRIAEVCLKYLEKKRDFKTYTIWIWGRSGSGKTTKAESLLIDPFVKDKRSKDWWEGYDQHEHVLYDEVNSKNSYSELKAISDRFPCLVECKGGSRQFVAKKLIITSLYDPVLLFKNKPEEGYEMLRRIDEIIYLPNRYNEIPEEICQKSL